MTQSTPDIVSRLTTLRDHLLGMDSGSGEAALLTATIATIASLTAQVDALGKERRTPGTVEVCPNGDCTREGAEEWGRCGNVECPLRAKENLSLIEDAAGEDI